MWSHRDGGAAAEVEVAGSHRGEGGVWAAVEFVLDAREEGGAEVEGEHAVGGGGVDGLAGEGGEGGVVEERGVDRRQRWDEGSGRGGER